MCYYREIGFVVVYLVRRICCWAYSNLGIFEM
jgi:hypothetical protein